MDAHMRSTSLWCLGDSGRCFARLNQHDGLEGKQVKLRPISIDVVVSQHDLKEK